MNNFQSRWFLPLLIFVSIFARIDKLNFLKKITYLQLLAISCFIIPMGLSILASNIGIIDKKIILSKIFQSHNIIEHINKNYKNEKIFSKLNYFYYFDNIVPVYHHKIVNKFDPGYYRKNEKNTKLILWPKEINPKNTTGVLKFVSQNFENIPASLRDYCISFLSDFDL